MYNYPVLIHYHRKDEAYQSCNFSKRPADSVEFVKEQEYFGEKISFTQSSETPLELMVFTVEKDGVSKEYPIRFNHYPLLTEVWILDGDDTVYYSENPAIASPHYKDQNPFAFDKAINSASFDHHWGYQGELGCQVSEATKTERNNKKIKENK